jgi:hypothetical protein
MASITPAGRSPAFMAWASMEVRTELINKRRPPMGRDLPLQLERRMSLFKIMGAKFVNRSL